MIFRHSSLLSFASFWYNGPSRKVEDLLILTSVGFDTVMSQSYIRFEATCGEMRGVKSHSATQNEPNFAELVCSNLLAMLSGSSKKEMRRLGSVSSLKQREATRYLRVDRRWSQRGLLTSDALAQKDPFHCGGDGFYFYDAAAPIIDVNTVSEQYLMSHMMTAYA